eukprot:scaffold1840_cov137-Skeletonema_dohrnii-CCMP3373.AAC.2
MSEANGTVATSSCCDSCGIAQVDDIKLMRCTACYLVRYCSDECQKNHASQHEEACKERAAKLRDELLFKQPESSYLGDCPICCLPMPLDKQKSFMMVCCSKVICNGCHHANMIREIEGKLERKCPFCRTPIPGTDEADEMMMKRVEANDPVAMHREGLNQYDKGDYTGAFEYFKKAAELGNVAAHYQLSNFYYDGRGVEKDKQKERHHLEEAAIGGHPYARFNLGCEEAESGSIERAVKHLIIAATQGDDDSIQSLLEIFKDGLVSKDDLASALRAHQSAVDATKSPQRDAAGEYD